MYIKELDIAHFGKYHNQKIELQKGVNVIYGPNEAGKSTIKEFIIAMFFGLERQRGTAAKTDAYTVHEPIDGGGYGGSMVIAEDGDEYLVARKFRKDEKSLTVTELSSGRELQTGSETSLSFVSRKSDGTPLINLDKNGYESTLCISSDGTKYGKNLYEQLNQYLANMETTRSSNLDLNEAYTYLNQQKKMWKLKDLEEEAKGLRDQMHEVDFQSRLEAIAKERDKIEQQILDAGGEDTWSEEATDTRNEESADTENEEPADTENVEQEENSEQAREGFFKRFWSNFQTNESTFSPQIKQIINFIKILFAFGIFGVILLLVYLLPVSFHYKLWLCVMAVIVLVGVWFWTTIKKWLWPENDKPDKDGGKTQSDQSSEHKPQENRAKTDRKKILKLSEQLANLQVEETKLLEHYAQLEQTRQRYEQVCEKMKQAKLELNAIELAKKRIEDLSCNIFDQYAFGMNQMISKAVCEITDGAITNVWIDEKLNIKIQKDGHSLGAEYLSTGTLEQIYLAVRFAVASVIGKNQMPILLDDIFGAYDAERRKNAWKYLAENMDEQIILFTASEELVDAMEQAEVEYNYIEL